MSSRTQRRIAVVGNSGSGKTTLATRLAAELHLTHIELDALFHQPSWTPTPPVEFQAKLSEAMDRAEADTRGWVTCGNYTNTADGLNQQRAETIVWLDISRQATMRRIIARTLRRGLKREVLWNDNRESLRNLFKWDPEENIVRWAWVKHEQYRDAYEAALSDGTWAHATVHRLRSTTDVENFVARCTG